MAGQLPFRFFGLFNFCSEIDTLFRGLRPVAQRVVLPPNGFVYYTELEKFFDIIEHLLADDGKKAFKEQYRDIFLSRDKEQILKVSFTIDLGYCLMQLRADPDSVIPLPMMILAK